MTVAEYIANQLFDHGVRYVFGIPGGASIPYMEAFRSAGIEFILVSNEATAGIMADVTARLTGIPGVCHATLGPGATNITTGIGGAFLDRSPVIVFTSELDDNMIKRVSQMNINHQELFRPITKATFRLNIGNVQQVMNSAFKICMEEYPGPVHIGLPLNIYNEEVIDVFIDEPADKRILFQNNKEDIAALLRKAKMPVIACGLTAERLKIGERLLAFLDRTPLPVLITPMAKGIIPENHRCYCGVLFHSLSDYLEDIYKDADLILGLGYDPVEFNYESWMADIPLIHFDTVQTALPYSGTYLQFVGQADEWFKLLEELEGSEISFDSTLIEDVKSEMNSVYEGFTNHFGPAAALKILHEELPVNVILTSDVGSHLHLAGQFWHLEGSRKILMTNGWSGMGFGIPAALAAQLNDGSSTVVCITGDGGFLMMAGELITARRYNLPLIVVVFSDGELNLIKIKQSWRDVPIYGTQLYTGDLFGADIFFGVTVLTADSTESMKKAVIRALSVTEPVIINAVIDPEDYRWLIVKR